MMAALKDWLMTVIAVSVLCAAADSLMPEGGVKKVGRLACALCVLCVMLSPLAAARGQNLTQWMENYEHELNEMRAQLEDQTGQTQKSVIEEACAAYVSDKAAQLGVQCRVEVDCVRHEEGLWLPQSIRLWGNFDDVNQSRMTELLEQQLGVSVDEQSYYGTKEGPA